MLSNCFLFLLWEFGKSKKVLKPGCRTNLKTKRSMMKTGGWNINKDISVNFSLKNCLKIIFQLLQVHLGIPAEEKTVLSIIEEMKGWSLLAQILPEKSQLTFWLNPEIPGKSDLSQVSATLALLSSCCSHHGLNPASSLLSRNATPSSIFDTAGNSGNFGTMNTFGLFSEDLCKR